MKASRRLVSVLCVGLVGAVASGCYYPPPPAVYYQSAFDQSWAAVLGAFADQGVQVVHQDRVAGFVRGNRNGVEPTASIRTQADGSVRVELSAGGNVAADPTLNDRIFQSYQRRMGR